MLKTTPKLRAGFILDPVRGMANRWQAVMDKPMASGADPFTLGELNWSAAAPNTTMTSTAVINISMTMASPTST